MSDQENFVSGSLKWLREFNMLENPALINNIYENIFLCHKSIQDAEIIISKENKTILVFLKLSWYGKVFKRIEVHGKVTSVVKTLLPEFRYRVTEDRAIFDLALNKARAYDKTFSNDPTGSIG